MFYYLHIAEGVSRQGWPVQFFFDSWGFFTQNISAVKIREARWGSPKWIGQIDPGFIKILPPQKYYIPGSSRWDSYFRSCLRKNFNMMWTFSIEVEIFTKTLSLRCDYPIIGVYVSISLDTPNMSQNMNLFNILQIATKSIRNPMQNWIIETLVSNFVKVDTFMVVKFIGFVEVCLLIFL